MASILNVIDLIHWSKLFCNRSAIGDSTISYGEKLQNKRTSPFSARFNSMRAQSKQLDEPRPLMTSILNGCDLCHWTNLFCNRSAMGIPSFRCGKRCCLATARPISAQSESMRALSNRFNEPHPNNTFGFKEWRPLLLVKFVL